MSDSATAHVAGTALRFLPARDHDAAGTHEPARGVWLGRDEAKRLYLRVAGDSRGPFPEYATALEALVGALAEVTSAIDRYVEALGPAASIPFGSRPKESFPVTICGFGAGLTQLDSIAVMDPSGASYAQISVVTGEPDGYVVYRVTLERGIPVHVDAVFT